MTLEAMVFQQEKLYFHQFGLNKELLQYSSIGSSGASWLDNHDQFGYWEQFANQDSQESFDIPSSEIISYYCPDQIDYSSPNNQFPLQTDNNHYHVARIINKGDCADHNSPELEVEVEAEAETSEAVSAVGGGGRRKRRRTKRREKDTEEIEKQRVTHIAVERNRRKQMNQYLAVLRSLMPPSYSQRGDQASIVGGAINFVKELEQHLQLLQAHYQHDHGHLNNKKKKRRTKPQSFQYTTPPSSVDSTVNIDSQVPYDQNDDDNNNEPSIFSDFFQLPQYSTSSRGGGSCYPNNDSFGGRRGAADVEVRVADSHANIKVRSTRQPKQLLRMMAGLGALRFTILHLHITTFHQTVLYSFNVKVEEGCQLNSVDEIATAVHDLMTGIRNQAVFD